MIITDQAAYSDQVFGLYWLLGYQFSPRPPRFRTSASGTSPATATTALQGLARNRINTGSVTLGLVSPRSPGRRTADGGHCCGHP